MREIIKDHLQCIYVLLIIINCDYLVRDSGRGNILSFGFIREFYKNNNSKFTLNPPKDNVTELFIKATVMNK